jgi:mannose-6-phosphate isomerase-like protein (cupin superfamily)
MTAGPVVLTADIPVDHKTGGARVRTLLDTGRAGPGLVRRFVEIPPGALLDGTAGSAGELWFVISGHGRLDGDGQAGLPLDPDRGLWIPPYLTYRINAAGSADLRIDAVTLPAGAPEPRGPAGVAAGGHAAPPDQAPPHHAAPQARDLGDCDVETTGDRRFRILFGPGQGCEVATQFLGEIPAGRAPEHSHPYDELVLILEGTGVLHLNGADHPLSAGSCVHLPPRQLHCLENTATAPMRVLGVFHPADSPAAKAETRHRGSSA